MVKCITTYQKLILCKNAIYKIDIIRWNQNQHEKSVAMCETCSNAVGIWLV